jgi:streptogramin lyase
LKAKLATIPTTRGAGLLASPADGRIVVFDRKTQALQTFDANGTAGVSTPLGDVTAIATDVYGRVFAATKDKLVRWDPGGPLTLVTLAAYGSPSALAVDAAGAIWIADRKGDRIGRWTFGGDEPATVRESKGAGVTALAVSGARVVAAEEKSGRIVAVDASGSEAAISTAAFRRPVSLTVDAAGRIAVLDLKAGTVTRLTPQGKVSETLSLEAAGVSKPLALAAAPDGAVRILDGATGAVVVAP